MPSSKSLHGALRGYRVFSQASQVLSQADATMALVPQPDLTQDLDLIAQEDQNLKDKSLAERQSSKVRIQELERDLATCRAETSQLKAPFTISDEEVIEKFQGIRISLSQSVEGFPKFPRFALNWQAIGEFMQDGAYSQDLSPWVGYDEEDLECEQDLLLLYSIWLIIYKWVYKLRLSVPTLTRKSYTIIGEFRLS
jgi:hypothetical protein